MTDLCKIALSVALPLLLAGADDRERGGPLTLSGTVIRVADGNTLHLHTEDGKKVSIRLIGLDAPHKATREVDGQEPWGTRAQQFLSLLVTRQTVRVEFDVVRAVPGEADLRWGYVWLGDKLLNEEMLRAGHALLATAPPNVKYVERLQKAQAEARSKGLGIWNPEEPLPEPPSKFVAKLQEDRAEQQAREGLQSLPAYVAGCVIGNVKSKKYHLPGGKYYELSKTSRNAIFFRTEEDARKAGYTPSAR